MFLITNLPFKLIELEHHIDYFHTVLIVVDYKAAK